MNSYLLFINKIKKDTIKYNKGKKDIFMKNKNILNESHFLLDIDVKNQTDAFEKISDLAQTLGCIENTDDLVEGFKNREK